MGAMPSHFVFIFHETWWRSFAESFTENFSSVSKLPIFQKHCFFKNGPKNVAKVENFFCILSNHHIGLFNGTWHVLIFWEVYEKQGFGCLRNGGCTVGIFLLHLGQKIFSWVIVKIIIYSLSNIMKYTMTRYFNYKNSNYHQEILQKTIQKILLGSTRVWTRDLHIVGPACYKRATQICYSREGFFILVKNVPCAQKIFVLLTSQSWKPEKK